MWKALIFVTALNTRSMIGDIYLWNVHTPVTIRMFIISTAADLPDLDLVTQRLLRNATEYIKHIEQGELSFFLRQFLYPKLYTLSGAKKSTGGRWAYFFKI